MAENSAISWTDRTEECAVRGTARRFLSRSPAVADSTSIEWFDSSFNPWLGGPGNPRVRTSAWRKPLTWNKNADAFAAEHGRRQRVFCASLADVFDNAVDPQWRADLYNLIAATPNLDWLLLTKRIGNVLNMVLFHWKQPGGWPSNIWLGATVCNQEEADRDIPKLLAVPARVRFLSVEPMLGPVDIRLFTRCPGRKNGPRPLSFGCGHELVGLPCTGVDWVIAGGESGPNARPAHPDWFRGLRDQCAGVAFHFKQWGEFHTAAFRVSDNVAVFRQFDNFQHWVNKAPTWVHGGICLDRHGTQLRIGSDFMRARDAGAFPVTIMHKVGKQAAGRTLDGVTHDGFPGMPDESCFFHDAGDADRKALERYGV